MNRITRTLWPAVFACIAWWALTIQAATAAELPRSTPEQQGISSAAVSDFVEALDTEIEDVHGLMVLRHGHVVAEGWWAPYRPEFIHSLFSLSKSFASTGIGLAIDEGHLSVHDQVISFFPDAAPEEPTWQLEAMRVSDLLSMSTGHIGEDLRAFSFDSDSPLPEAFLNLPVAHKPGTHFNYNTPASYMLSAIVHTLTGENLLDYLRPRLLDPLGIEEATWSTDSQGVAHGGFGLSITTESIARFGQLYLQKGEWEGEQLLPAEWVEQATSRQTSNGSNPDGDWDQGYGYQFWRSRHGYRGDGAGGQFAIVLPEQDAVVATTSGTSQMGDIMSIVWDRLLPAMQDEPLDENPAEAERLREQLSNLSIRIPAADPDTNGNREWLGGAWQFEENDFDINALAVRDQDDQTVVVITTPTGEHEIVVGNGAWAADRTGLFPGAVGSLLGDDQGQGHRMAAAGAWTGTDEFTFRLAYTETPRVATITLQFSEASLTLDIDQIGGFAPRVDPLTGTPISE
ncbi:MAG: serine hydrolase [Proteobacteria bacterium]|nr:serine hydrolase [Pseudomonadota bacterium]